jgi:hypothetical protein
VLRVLFEDVPVDHLRGLWIPGFFVLAGFLHLLFKRHSPAGGGIHRLAGGASFEPLCVVDLFVGHGSSRIEAHGCLKGGPGRGDLSLHEQQVPKRLMGQGEIGKQLNSLLDMFFRYAEVAQGNVRPGCQAEEICVARKQFQALVAKFGSCLHIARAKLSERCLKL